MSEFVEAVSERHGLFRNVPRSIRKAIERRLATLEADEAAWDRAALEQGARLKRLYALLHIPPGDRARALFGKPLAGSAREALRGLIGADPDRASALVREHRLPFLLVEAVLGKIPPEVAVALLETMPADELLARLPLIARRQLIEGTVRDALLMRLGRLARTTDTRPDHRTIEALLRKTKFDRPLAEALYALVEKPAAAGLTGDTALLVDATIPREGGSLTLAAAVGRRIDQVLDIEARLDVVAFAAGAELVSVARGSGLDRWQEALRLPAPGGVGTSIGAAVATLTERRLAPRRLVIVTDGLENRPPRLVAALGAHRDALGRLPDVALVQPADGAKQAATDLRNAQIRFDSFVADPHALGLDFLVAALAAGGHDDRIDRIMALA